MSPVAVLGVGVAALDGAGGEAGPLQGDRADGHPVGGGRGAGPVVPGVVHVVRGPAVVAGVRHVAGVQVEVRRRATGQGVEPVLHLAIVIEGFLLFQMKWVDLAGDEDGLCDGGL